MALLIVAEADKDDEEEVEEEELIRTLLPLLRAAPAGADRWLWKESNLPFSRGKKGLGLAREDSYI